MKEFGPQQSSALASMVEPDRFSAGQSNRELHLHDISPHYGTLPAGIIWSVIRITNKNGQSSKK